jgi:hypothetical protein
MARTRREFIKTRAAAGAIFGSVGAVATDAAQARHDITLHPLALSSDGNVRPNIPYLCAAWHSNLTGTRLRCFEPRRNERAR